MASMLTSTKKACASCAGLLLLAFSLTPSALFAQTSGTVTLKISGAYLTDDSGLAFGDDGDRRLVVFVADLNGDGVAHPTADAFAPGSDDFVIGTLGTTFDGSGTAVLGSLNLFANTELYAGGPIVGTGDSFAMFWYPELFHTNYIDVDLDGWEALMPGDTAFGAYNTPQSTEDLDWTVPNPPSLVDYNAFTTEVPGVGTLDPIALQARFLTDGTVIPEPSTALLALLGASFCGTLRRRRRSA